MPPCRKVIGSNCAPRSVAPPIRCRCHIYRQLPGSVRRPKSTASRTRLVLEDEEAGESGVHVSVQVRGAVQQQQPDLFVALQAEDDDVGRRRPVRDALRPDRGHHAAVLDDHHRRLLAATSQTNTDNILMPILLTKKTLKCLYNFVEGKYCTGA